MIDKTIPLDEQIAALEQYQAIASDLYLEDQSLWDGEQND